MDRNQEFLEAARRGKVSWVEFGPHVSKLDLEAGMRIGAENGHVGVITFCRQNGAKKFNAAFLAAVRSNHRSSAGYLCRLGATNLKAALTVARNCGHEAMARDIERWIVNPRRFK